MDRGRTRLNVEELTSRIAPSSLVFRAFGNDTTVIAYSPPVYQGFRVFANHPLLPEGTASGTYSVGAGSASSGSAYNISGTADLMGIGKISFTGSVSTVGGSRSVATGSLLLSSSEGQISMILSGIGTSSPNQLSHQMVFTVNGVSGEFTHIGGSGVITFTTSHASGSTGNVSMSIT
jgi:hypothetical protein